MREHATTGQARGVQVLMERDGAAGVNLKNGRLPEFTLKKSRPEITKLQDFSWEVVQSSPGVGSHFVPRGRATLTRTLLKRPTLPCRTSPSPSRRLAFSPGTHVCSVSGAAARVARRVPNTFDSRVKCAYGLHFKAAQLHNMLRLTATLKRMRILLLFTRYQKLQNATFRRSQIEMCQLQYMPLQDC